MVVGTLYGDKPGSCHIRAHLQVRKVNHKEEELESDATTLKQLSNLAPVDVFRPFSLSRFLHFVTTSFVWLGSILDSWLSPRRRQDQGTDAATPGAIEDFVDIEGAHDDEMFHMLLEELE